MTNRNWDKARAIDRTRKGPAPTAELAPNSPPRRKNQVPFAQVYAKYANGERAKGRKPLPPKQWIATLKQGRPSHT